MHTESIWQANFGDRSQLRKNIETEVAVIGAGLAGLLIAFSLQRAGKDVVVLEAEEIAGGATKNTTAKITSQHNCIYEKLIRRFGKEKAGQYAAANQRAVAWYRQLIRGEGIDCDYEEQAAFIYSLNDRQKLLKEAEACKALSLPAEFITELPLPFTVAGAVRMAGQAQFHPLRFAAHIAGKLRIYTRTRVKKAEGHTLFCDAVAVKARHIVFACHYPFVNFPGLYFTRMHQDRSYVLALENATPLQGMYIDIEQGGYSFRSYGDLLLMGGGQHRTGVCKDGTGYTALQGAAKTMFPGSIVRAQWSAQDCITADGVPYIGRFSKSRPDWYVATGFGKWGMTSAAVAAELITDLICGRKNPAEDVFTPSRFPAVNTIKIAGEGAQAVKGLVKANLSVAHTPLSALSVGQGGIVEYQGKTIGAYRESEDKYHLVQVQCPHLGCRLEWNPEEKSWDCPCHGSRYDYTGQLLDNPAQRPTIKED